MFIEAGSMSKSPSSDAIYKDRLARFRALMAKNKLDAFLINNRMDQFWLTGFTGEDGAVLVTPGQVVLLTDGRFDEAATLEAPWCRKVVRKVRDAKTNATVIRRFKPRRVGFEPAHLDVANFVALTRELKPARLVAISGLMRGLRMIKDTAEVVAIRNAIRIAEAVFSVMNAWLKPGLREREIAARLVYEMQNAGAQAPSFAPIIAAGANGSLPHYEAGDARIDAASPLLVDWGARAGWYVSDLTRMVWLGSIPAELWKPFDTCRKAHDAAISAIKPGAKAATVDKAARSVISEAGLGERFTHALGHGIGLDVHEAPRLGKQSKDVLAAGMVVTVEPGIYLPGVGGVRVESDVLVTPSGCEVLSTLPY